MFLSEEAAVDPATLTPGNLGDGSGNPTRPVTPKVSLERLAAPGRAKTAAAPSAAPAEKPIFTRAQIADFYAQSTAGKFRGNLAEKARIEAEIFAAQREGRVR